MLYSSRTRYRKAVYLSSALLLGVWTRTIDLEPAEMPPQDWPELRMVSPEPVETDV
jgi:hypothetical protein